jgi:hypothetical protein
MREMPERPYHCQLCNAALAEEECGFVCEHVAHGAWNTLVADGPVKGKRIPDTPCTACAFAMKAGKKNAEEKANIHIVCLDCYRKLRLQNIDAFDKDDVERGYVLVPRSKYDRVVKREINLEVGPITVGRTLKLGFSPIPSTHPISLERMWVRVTCIMKGGVVHGSLANDPELFKRKVLKANDTVVFRATHVLETEPPKPARKAKSEPKPKPAPKKPAPKKAAKKAGRR